MIPAFDAEIRAGQYRVVEIDDRTVYIVDTDDTNNRLTRIITLTAAPYQYQLDNIATLLAMVLNADLDTNTLYDALTEYKDRQKRDADCPF